MTKIDLSRFTTIAAKPGEIYQINCSRYCHICVKNQTGCEMWISDDSTVPKDKSICLSEEEGYNALSVQGYVFMKAATAGQIGIVMEG